MATVRDLEAVVVGLDLGRQLAVVIDQGAIVLVVPGVADAAEEEQREDVRLEVSWIDRSAQGVGGSPEARLKLLLSQTFRTVLHPHSCVPSGLLDQASVNA